MTFLVVSCHPRRSPGERGLAEVGEGVRHRIAGPRSTLLCRVLSSIRKNRVGADTSQAGSRCPAGIPGPLLSGLAPGSRVLSLSHVIVYWLFPWGVPLPFFNFPLISGLRQWTCEKCSF